MPKRKRRPQPPDNRLVVALAYNGLCTFEFGVAVEIFGLDRPEMDNAWYRFQVAAIEPGPMRAMGGISVAADGGQSLIEQAGTIIVPGWRGADSPVPQRLIKALRRAHKRGARLLSFCSGVFVLAATGLLDGKRVATHWASCARLAEKFPAVSVDAESLYVVDGKVWTSAGVTTGIDMALALVEADLGAATANLIARHFVLYARRPGYQSQFSPMLQAQATADAPFASLIDWMQDHLDRELDVPALARHAGYSERSFYRKFTEATGKTPAHFVEDLRLDAARTLLSKGLSLKTIAGRVGLKSSARLGQAFERRFGMPPSLFRQMHPGQPDLEKRAA